MYTVQDVYWKIVQMQCASVWGFVPFKLIRDCYLIFSKQLNFLVSHITQNMSENGKVILMEMLYLLIGKKNYAYFGLFSLFFFVHLLHLKYVSASQDELQAKGLSWSETCDIQILTLAMISGNNVNQLLCCEKNPSFSSLVEARTSSVLGRKPNIYI